MASDVSLSDCEMDSWEDNEDWTSTEWADPNNGKKNVTPLLHPGSHQNNNAESQNLKLKALHSANNLASTPDGSTVVKRMLLNDNKAGMEGLDKERINQIIHEASKGSKFYENERQKEEQMKRRIEEQRQKINQISMEQLRHGTIEADKLLEDFEQQRDLSHTIVHIDMDAFYAAVEMRDDPSLKNKPMAVGGDNMLSTSNYHARKFGVRAAMPGFIGRKLCPELVIVPLNFEKYTSVSKQVKSIIAEYDANFCPMSLDEAYLDLTEHLKKRLSMPVKERTFICRDSDYADSRSHCKCDLNEIKSEYAEEDITIDKLNDFFTKSEHFQVVQQDTDSPKATIIDKEGKCVVCIKCKKVLPPFKLVTFGMSDEDAVNELRTRIEQKTTLTASAGIAPNMMLAKVCSDKNKPNGQYKIEPNRETVMEFIKNLPTRKVSGIGKVSEAMLNAVGVYTCTDLYEKRGLLYHLYSQISFNYFMRICLGIGSTTVERDSERKSMSTERTFSELNRPADLYQKCEELCESLSEDLKSEQLKGKTVSIKIKTVKFEVRTRAHTVRDYTNDYKDILHSAMELLKTEIQNCSPQPLRLRLMGVRMSNLLHESLCRGKKQNTIIGAFKRLARPAEKLDTNDSKVSDVVIALDVAIDGLKSVCSINTLSDNSDVTRETSEKIQLSHTDNMSGTFFNRMNDNERHIDLDKAKGSFVSGMEVYNETNQNAKASGNFNVGVEKDTKSVDDSKELIENAAEKNVHVGIVNDYNGVEDMVENVSTKPKAFTEDIVSVKQVENSDTREEQYSEHRGDLDKDLQVGTVPDLGKVLTEKGASEEESTSNLYSPNVRKTRSGIKRTPVSQTKQKKRKGRRGKDTAVTYECPVCSLKILCESLNIFNEHVDNCLESGVTRKQDIDGDKTVIKEEYIELKNGDAIIGSGVNRTKSVGEDKSVIKQSDEPESEDEAMTRSYRNKGNADICDTIKFDKSTCLPEKEVEADKTETEEKHISFLKKADTEKEVTDMPVETGNVEAVIKCKDDITLTTENQRNIDSFTNTRHVDTITVDEQVQQFSLKDKEVDEEINVSDCSSGPLRSVVNNQVGEINKECKMYDVKSESVSVNKEAISKHINHLPTFNESETVTERTPEKATSMKIESDCIHRDIKNNESVNDRLSMDKCSVAYNKSIDIHRTEENDVPKLDSTENERTESCETNEMNTIDDQKIVELESAYVIPISPRIIVNNRKEHCVEPGRVCAGTSKQSDERYHEMARSDAWVRKNLLQVSDEIEELNENSAVDDSDDDEEKEGSLLVCPICNIEQRSADLTEFNSHVDMCLSRGAISEILKEQKSKDSGSLKRNRTSETPGSAKSAKRRKTAMPNISKPCRSIASFFQEK